MKNNLKIYILCVALVIVCCTKNNSNYTIENGIVILQNVEITIEDRKKNDATYTVIKHEEELKEAIKYFINSILRKDTNALLELIDGSYDVVVPEGIRYGEHLSKQQMKDDFLNHGPLYLIYFDPAGFDRFQKQKGYKGEDYQKSFYEKIYTGVLKKNFRISNIYPMIDSPDIYSVNIRFSWDDYDEGLNTYVIGMRYNTKKKKWFIDDLMCTVMVFT